MHLRKMSSDREDGHSQAKKKGIEQIFPLQLSKRTISAYNLPCTSSLQNSETNFCCLSQLVLVFCCGRQQIKTDFSIRKWGSVLTTTTKKMQNLVISRGQDSFGEGNGNPLQYSCLENPMDRGAWWAAVHEVAKSQTGLSDFTFTFHFHALEKEMATHSSVLAWRIPEMGEPGGLLSMRSHRVRHD